MNNKLCWKAEDTPPEIAAALQVLSEHYPIEEGEGKPRLRFKQAGKAGAYQLKRAGGEIEINYGEVCDALRGLGAALARPLEQSNTISEERPFTTIGIMLDCSRNAVMKVEHVERWLRCLALLGYNMVMLYTEDTYQLPGEPFFGLFRGAYSAEELKRLDDYATRLGIELIGCIQTLGHMEQALKWGAYWTVRDTDSELLVGEPKTYELIEKMIAQFAACFRSRRIHIGMDETWQLGRGRYLDLNGHRSGYDIITEHLTKVTAICDKHGLRPMIWSDMFFKFGGDMGQNYDEASNIPEAVTKAIPPKLDLVYWDYYHDTIEHYLKLIERHRQFGRDPVMGSGVWTWHQLWYGKERTEAYAKPCVQACKKAGLKEIFFTMWGDDGGYCEYESSLAGLAFVAAECWGEEEAELKQRFRAVCGAAYEDVAIASGLDGRFIEGGPEEACAGMGMPILWDDPLLGLQWLGVKARQPGFWPQALDHYQRLSCALESRRSQLEPIDFGYAASLAALLAAKINFRLELEKAYAARERSALAALVKDAARVAELTEEVAQAFRRQWLRRNKPFGLETIQIRLGGLRQRYLEAGRRLQELLDGVRTSIPELEEGLNLSEQTLKDLHVWGLHRRIATAGIL